MKAISTGNTFVIYDDTLKTYDKLPAQTYIVRFNRNQGFYLEKYSDIEINESKIYGVHNVKIKKVLGSFNQFNRSLGVILSGDKGIGKSLFAKLLAVESIKIGLPLIIVDTAIPGIASYLESIEQEVVVLFDEFDKTFANNGSDNNPCPQVDLLTLFDGIAQGKKLFVITCNELRGLNEYFLNRPGRFHYHFRFEYPSPEEVEIYLKDKLAEQFYGEITKVVAFSRKIKLNYDCLRSIVFELNIGETFENAIKDLNIINTERERYSVTLHYSNGFTAIASNVYLDLFADDNEYIHVYDRQGKGFADIEFNSANCTFNTEKLMNIVYPDSLKIYYDDDDREASVKDTQVEYLSIVRKYSKDIHYSL